MLSALGIENSPFNEQQLKQLQSTIGDLNPAQSQWLSGYLAGRLAAPLQGVSSPQTSSEPALTVVYATETGNSESIATTLHSGLEQQGIKAELKAMGDLRPAGLRKLKNVVFIVSTHGEGDPPDEALELFEYLDSERAPGLAELNYRVLALGDRSYLKFCEAGRKLDEMLQALGASSFGPRVECDVDYVAGAKTYTEEVIEYALNELATTEPPLKTQAPALSLVSNESRWSRANPFNAQVEQIQKITGSDSGKDVYHIELSLDDADLKYEAGDALGVWAPNDPELVNLILTGLEIGPSEIINFNEQDMTISKVLTSP